MPAMMIIYPQKDKPEYCLALAFLAALLSCAIGHSTQIVEARHDRDGRIVVDGFFDEVVPLSEEDRHQIAQLPHDDEKYKSMFGYFARYS